MYKANKGVVVVVDSVYDTEADDPVKTTLSELEAKGEEPANHKARNRSSIAIGLFFRFHF